jgi:SARP family transcriptional regulator, regulator of embCAB operon
LVVGELEALVAEHPFREPVWAQLITAYYLAGRQSDALDAYRRLSTILADELGIDPNTELRDLHGRILRQEHLDVAQLAQLTAERTISTSLQRMTAGPGSRMDAWLRSAAGQWHPIKGMATTIGRLPDNDIVLNDGKVSRRHAVIVNTGISFVIYDAGSANGVEMHGRLITNSAPLSDGDEIRIGTTDFVFEMRESSGEKTTEKLRTL